MLNVKIDGQMSESVFIGDIEMYPEEIGYVNVLLESEHKLSPYFGIGFGRGIPIKRRISYAFEIGLLYHGKPQVDLSTTGMLEPTSSEEQELLIENNIAPLTFWPVVSFRIAYKLNNN